MRMWMVPPEGLCRNHLLGEHRELHSMIGMVRERMWASIKGHTAQGQIYVPLIVSRHEEVVAEMARRGYNHHSPLEWPPSYLEVQPPQYTLGPNKIDVAANIDDLMARCKECAF